MAIARYSGSTPTPGSTVSVFAQGTQNLVDLFEDLAGLVPMANPFTSDTLSGNYTYCTENVLLDETIGAATVVPATREPLPPSVVFSGVSPARVATLWAEDPDTGEQVVFAQVVY